MKESCLKGSFCSKEGVGKGCHSRFCRPQDSGIYNACRCKIKGNALCSNDRYVEDPRQNSSGMTALLITARGFTLIELLVVVLIIGILAAIAVPQYQKAVKKARITQQITTIRALYQALEMYRLAHGEYPPTKDNKSVIDASYFNELLDIDVQPGKVNYFPGMFIGQSHISVNWAINGGPGKGLLICGSHPSYSDYEKRKSVCLAFCTDKQWRTWDHGEYCII